MATSTNGSDYGLAVYNDSGLNVLGRLLLAPKLIGRMVLRQKDWGELFVVAEDGTELPSADGSRNVPLDDLRGSMRNITGKPHPNRLLDMDSLSEWHTPLSYRYVFSPYGGQRQAALLPAVIHGWGGPYHERKWEMADLLTHSVVSGMELHAARLFLKDDAFLQERKYYGIAHAFESSEQEQLYTGLPFTVTYRCTSIGQADDNGFGAVMFLSGFMLVEMMRHTEMEICFYETAGIPSEYFAKCTSGKAVDAYGVTAYDYEPQLMKYAMPHTDPDIVLGGALKISGLEMGAITRGEYFFAPRGINTPQGLVQGLSQQDMLRKELLAGFLEGHPKADLRYEKYSNHSARLRLAANLGQRSGTQIEMRGAYGGATRLYTVKAGHDYSKIHAAPHHACMGAGQVAGGVESLIAGVEGFSMFSHQVGNIPESAAVELDEIPAGVRVSADYNGAPWNPTKDIRRSDFVLYATGADMFMPVPPSEKPGFLAGNIPALLKFNEAVYSKTWKIQYLWNKVTMPDPVLGRIPNPDYSPDAAEARNKALEEQSRWLNNERRRRELEAAFKPPEAADVPLSMRAANDIYADRMQRMDAIRAKAAAIVDDQTSVQSSEIPFFNSFAHRHSADKLEVLAMMNGQGVISQEIKYVPDNWIMCQAPY